jgi:hypothetical protein
MAYKGLFPLKNLIQPGFAGHAVKPVNFSPEASHAPSEEQTGPTSSRGPGM